MPIRRPSEGADRVGDNSTSILGIDLLQFQEPVRNASMEALLTGKYNAITDPTRKIRILCDSRSYSAWYSALWNIADVALQNGSKPVRVCLELRRAIEASQNGSCISFRSFKENIFTDVFLATSENRSSNTQEKAVSPFVTAEVIAALGEEGILESDAKEAVTYLLDSGTLKKSMITPGGILFSYGDERRRIISRILNYINDRRSTLALRRAQRVQEPQQTQQTRNNGPFEVYEF